MSRGLQPEADLNQYLLGRLRPEERAQLEARLFTNDALSEELAASADDLIHAYLAGQLSREDRADFEAHFLSSPRRRERVAFVRDLLTAVGRVAASGPPVGKRRSEAAWAALAAAAVLLAALAVALQPRQPRPERRVATSGPSPRPVSSPPRDSVASPAETPAPAPTVRPAPTAAVVRAVRLPQTPAPRPVDVRLSAATSLVRLEVPVSSEGPPSYDAVVRRADGREVWRAEGLAPAGPGEPLEVEVPARALAGGDYQLSVEAEVLRDAHATPWPTLHFALRVLRER